MMPRCRDDIAARTPIAVFWQARFTTCLVAATEKSGRNPATVRTMPCAYMIRYIREAAGRFIAANDGNIAVIFTIALVPIISFVGAAIDYSRANSAKSAMQAAMDSAGLMVGKGPVGGPLNRPP